jgi:hypothetical protein
MAQNQNLKVNSTERLEITAPDHVQATVTNQGPDTVYYATASTVSASSNDGSLAMGASLTFSASKWFISAGRSRLWVDVPSAFEALRDTVYTDAAVDAIEHQSTPISAKIATLGDYADSGSGNIFHLASYVDNTGTRATVAVFGGAKGNHVFGGNFVAYSNGASDTAIGVELDFGNVDAGGGTAYGLVIKSAGGNIGGSGGKNYIQMQANTSSSTDNGIVFHKSDTVTAVAPTGSLILAEGEAAARGVNFAGSSFTTTAAYLPLNSGSATASQGLILAAEGGFANAGNYIDIRSSAASSSGEYGLLFRLSGGRQPVTGSLIRAATGITASIGLDFAGATLTTGIAMGDNNLSCGTTTGMEIATASTQKIGFWGAVPVTRQSGWGSPSGTATRTTFDTATVTTAQLAERVRALIDDLKTYGLLGG